MLRRPSCVALLLISLASRAHAQEREPATTVGDSTIVAASVGGDATAPSPSPPTATPRGATQFDLRAGMVLDEGLGTFNIGFGASAWVRGWFGSQRIIGWGVGLTFGTTRASCAGFGGWQCTAAVGGTWSTIDASVDSWALPFALSIALGSRVRDVFEIAPGIAHVQGDVSHQPFDAVLFTTTVMGGLDIRLYDFLSLEVRAGYRVTVQDLSDDPSGAAAAAAPGMVGRAGLVVTI